QTVQVGVASGTGTDGQPGFGAWTNEVTVVPGTLPVATAVAPTPITLGGAFRDTATIGPPAAGLPAPTGTVTFSVFAPGDTGCSGSASFTSVIALTGAGTSAVSGSFTPTTTGTYRVVASYSGDANYASLATACNDTGEAAVVTPAPSPIATAVSPASFALGGSFHDTATLSPPAGTAAPTGSVTFDVFSPGNTTCSGSPSFTSVITLTGAGTSGVSGTFTPTATGTYRVIASYSGDANYSASATACNDAGEAAVVTPASLPIATAASVAADGSFSDTATIGPAPVGVTPPTGSVTFSVYGPGDATCAGPAVFSSVNGLSAAGTSATSNAFRASAASGGPGTYRFVAAYGGDANYSAASSACNAANESVGIPAPVIAVTKAAAPASRAEPGGTFTFTAIVSNPSTVDPIKITSLVDDIYGDLATRAGSTCGALIGVTLAPGASSSSCSFTGLFMGVAGASQTDTVTVNGVDQNGFSATATALATVTLTPAPAAAPVVSSLSPTSGPEAGGTAVAITGTGFAGATAVSFGGKPAAGFTLDSPTQVTATAPAGSGTVDVTVTTPAGASAAGTSDRYTYVAAPTPPTPVGAPRTVTGPPNVISSSSAELTATITPEGLPTTMHFEYTAELPGGVSSGAITYDQQTPEQPVGSDFADHAVTAVVAGLTPNSTYHVRALAANSSGVTPSLDATFTTAADPPPPPPVLGKAVNAQPIAGTVLVLLPGQGHLAQAQAHASAAKGVGFIPLTEARQLPVGTIFDTSTGMVRLTSATVVKGQPQTGDFGGGVFKLLQNRKERGLTELDLVVSAATAKTCPTVGKAAVAAASKALPKAVLNLLRASDNKGRFRTKGRYSSATVRGTVWTMSDRCDGTLTTVKRGSVVVSDFRRKRQIVVRAGRSYLARAR
ncbi:MAG: hypothetical protein QOE27_659, partial [Solirubrobacteraceae bacterium]|nr:hypothetical protein [Solirubrobacteraceae bacterium]